MKFSWSFIVCFFISIITWSQVGIVTPAPHSSAQFEINSSNKANFNLNCFKNLPLEKRTSPSDQVFSSSRYSSG